MTGIRINVKDRRVNGAMTVAQPESGGLPPWWRGVPEGPSGLASWAVQEQLRAAARAMLLAGALAAVEHVGYHPRAAAAPAGVLIGPAHGGRRLTGAHDLVPVRMESSEGDRLMKSVQENLDFFEEACDTD